MSLGNKLQPLLILTKPFECRSRVSEVDKDFKECRDSLERLSSSNDPLSGFGQYMIEIVNTIKRNQGRFSQLPKGPIGR